MNIITIILWLAGMITLILSIFIQDAYLINITTVFLAFPAGVAAGRAFAELS